MTSPYWETTDTVELGVISTLYVPDTKPRQIIAQLVQSQMDGGFYVTFGPPWRNVVVYVPTIPTNFNLRDAQGLVDVGVQMYLENLIARLP